MTRKIHSLIFSFCCLLQVTALFGQSTTEIDYPAWNPTSPPCNLFGAPIDVAAKKDGVDVNIQHQTLLGQPKYSSTKCVQLDCQYVSTSSSLGTKYRLAYTFKSGYTYIITVNSAELIHSTTPDPYLKLELTTNTGGNGTGCNGPQSISTDATGTPAPIQVTSVNFTNQQYEFVPNGGKLALEVSVFPAPMSSSNSILIKKITIVEIAPAPATPVFTLGSNPISVTCGATTPKTLTITNTTNSPGVTGYTWNLGASNNWLYNGVAAGATITTGAGVNSITLTPSGCGTPSNITAAATIGGTGYATNTATVSITSPTLSINGSAAFCGTQQTYSINGLPCNASVIWSLSPATGVASPSCTNCNQTTLTKTGNGNVTLTAKVTSCGVEQTLTLPVHVGAYTSADYSISGNNGSVYFCPNQSLTFSLSGGTGTSYNWTWPTGWSYIYGQGGAFVAVKTASGSYPPTGNVTVAFTEPCGSAINVTRFLIYNNNDCGSTPYTITPNPATSTITNACASLQTYCNIAAVQITSINNSNVISSQTWQNTNTQVQMPISFLQPGNYIARIYNGTQWYSMQFIKQ